jgi:3-oxoacyl-[acyl-carrier protein] reductase
MKSKPVTELSLDLWNEVIGLNLTGVFLTTKAFLPAMIERNRGDIIMMSSMSGKKGDPGASVYDASKFGLQGFSQALMHEVRRHNIRVMVINPSRVDTSDTPSDTFGPGLTLHAQDLAETALHMVTLPGRAMIRDMDVWGTNPFSP